MRPLYVLTIMLAVLFAVPRAQDDELSVRLELPAQLSKNLPQFSARDGEGESLFQKRHLERMIDPETKRVVLVFFATWCMPCAKGAAMIRNSRSVLKENGVLVVFVNVGEREVLPVQKWLARYGDPTLPLIIDSRSQMAGALGLLEPSGMMIMPKALILDRKLKPLFLLGTEGRDFPKVLWEHNP